MQSAPIRPVFRWAGSKRKLLPELANTVARPFDRYIEPFFGSGCLFFALQPKAALLGDINKELIATYRTIRSRPRIVATTAHQMPQTKRFYYQLRDGDITCTSALEKAARFVYLNRFSFNGVYRVNSKGEFNVPRGSRTGAIPSIDEFVKCANALKIASLYSGDFQTCIDQGKAGDLIYLDPPYALAARLGRGEYGTTCFSESDFERLSASVRAADQRGAKILISYADVPQFRRMFKDWHTRTLMVRRHVGGFSQHRETVTELLISNYRMPINK